MDVLPLEGSLHAHAFQGMTFPSYLPALNAACAGDPRALAIGAFDEGDAPLGLLLAGREGPRAEILSVFTRADRRRAGVAKALLAAAEKRLAAFGVSTVEASIERGRPFRDAAEALLAGAGYGPFKRSSFMMRCLGPAKVRAAPWVRRLSIPAAFEAFPWTELAPGERSAIVSRQQREHWIPDNLYPFVEEEWLEPANSLGLRYAGEVVGWQVNHRLIPHTVRYTYTFVRADLQPSGVALALLAESVRRHVDTALIEAAPNATFKVPAEFEGMTRFVDKHWRGVADEVNEVVKGAKALA